MLSTEDEAVARFKFRAERVKRVENLIRNLPDLSDQDCDWKEVLRELLALAQ